MIQCAKTLSTSGVDMVSRVRRPRFRGISKFWISRVRRPRFRGMSKLWNFYENNNRDLDLCSRPRNGRRTELWPEEETSPWMNWQGWAIKNRSQLVADWNGSLWFFRCLHLTLNHNARILSLGISISREALHHLSWRTFKVHEASFGENLKIRLEQNLVSSPILKEVVLHMRRSLQWSKLHRVLPRGYWNLKNMFTIFQYLTKRSKNKKWSVRLD